MKRTLVISDIHGCYDEFIELLEKANYHPDTDRLVILGDMIDRGKKSMQVVKHIMELKSKYDVVVIGGNHEDLFLNWLEEPFDKNHLYGQNGGWKTIESYCKPYKVYGKTIKTKAVFRRFYQNHLDFFKSLLDYEEDEEYIFVHAGVDLTLSNWKETSSEQFKWLRDEFWNQLNHTGKTIVFGHTPTWFFHAQKKVESYDVWFFDDKKICIDGGCSMGGKLHCLILFNHTHDIVSVEKITN